MSVAGPHVVAEGLRPLLTPPRGVPSYTAELPPAHDFLLSAGFGGLTAVLAALIFAVVATFAARRSSHRHRSQLEQQDRHHQESRADAQRAEAVNRCWQRLVWVVETAGLEPAASEDATLGLGPELAVELLRGLLRDAEQLGDDTLAKSVAVYLNQFSLVLAQQAGPLSGLPAAARPLPDRQPPPPPDDPESAPPPADDSRPRRRHG